MGSGERYFAPTQIRQNYIDYIPRGGPRFLRVSSDILVKMILKNALSLLATGLTLVGFFPYIRSILKGDTRPHVFSWVIWGITTLLAFAGQWAGHGGVGTWSTAVSGAITVGIAVLAYYRKGDISIHRIDWIFLIAAVAAIPIWIVTSDPFWAVLLLTTDDVLGFFPTIRKSMVDPYSENLTTYWILLFRNLVSIVALEHYSATTVMFPAAMSVTIVIMIPLLLYYRRRVRAGGEKVKNQQ